MVVVVLEVAVVDVIVVVNVEGNAWDEAEVDMLVVPWLLHALDVDGVDERDGDEDVDEVDVGEYVRVHALVV